MARNNRRTTLLDYLTANADALLTLDRMTADMGWTRNQVSSAVHAAVETGRYPNLRRIGSGVYQWDSTPIVASSTWAGEIIIEVLTADEEKMLAKDEEGTLWVMRRLEY